MIEQNYSGKPFSVVVARVRDEGFGRVEIIDSNDVMIVEIISRSIVDFIRNISADDFLNGESKEFEHIFHAQAVFNLDRSSTKTITLDDHQYSVLTVLKVIIGFGAKVTLQKNKQGEIQAIETSIKDVNFEKSSFNVDVIGDDYDVPVDKFKAFKQLGDRDIHMPGDESIEMKNEVLLNIFNSLNLQTLITGVVFINESNKDFL